MSADPVAASDRPVLVIGAAGVDLVGQLKGELAPGSSSPAHIRSSFGGVARNVAENLARLGQSATLLTAVGEDPIGEQLLQVTAASGVNIDHVLRTPEYATGSYLAVVNPAGRLRFALDDMRALARLTPAYVQDHASLFGEAALLFIDANLPKDTLRAIMSLARKAHLPVCADPTSTTLAGRLQPHLSRLYLITPNSAEAAILCDNPSIPAKPRPALEAAKCLVSQGVKIAIITLAEFGVVYATSQTSGHIPAIRTSIVDPTGAGDALTAAVMFALLNDIHLDDAMRLGVSAATLALRARGTVAADLSLEKLYDQLVI
jgi:pseudouridine kinase